ncbi:uncharacterized protein LOC121739084 [Aricia agestis]|uniref:uncharacterized protein LOC121739084 n=1 Tax=Aricia agestis TaxID=91739 RepID=UPI001C2047AE|nr:uncharacterized protein LOC121739084 [Aricia agestis]
MCPILKKVYDVDPNNSEGVKEAVTSFFQHLSKHKEVETNAWLRALEHVICRFPKYCVSHRNNIEVYVSGYLNTNDYFQVIEAAKCAHAVQQVRQPQDKGATAKTSWRYQINSLCKAAHTLIDALFKNAVDMYKGISEDKTPSSSTPFSSVLDNITKVPNNVNRKPLLLTRLKNILVFIQAMLVEIYPVAKPIEPQIILDLALRSQSVTSGAEINQQLADIKVEALRTLDALVICLGSNLLPYSPLIVRFVMQTLRWSSDNPSEEASCVRCHAYRSLRRWLSVLRCHKCGDSWLEQLTAHILDDITPATKTVQLTIGPAPVKHMSKKARRKQANAMLKESSIAVHMPGEKNKIHSNKTVSNEVAMAALNCAEIFLTVCGRFLKPTTHKIYQERLVRECFNADSYKSEQLLALLSVLEASRKTTPFGVPPPTQYCLHLYSVLLNRNEEISKFCSQAILDIRLHLHCSPPSLNYNLETPISEQNGSSKRKKVSEKNRAALEALLGKDRVTQLDYDVIVPDEPSPKKPRLEVQDNISISSGSSSSVVVSDESDDDVQEVEITAEESEKTDNIEETVVNKTVENNIEEEIMVGKIVENNSNDNVDSTSQNEIDTHATQISITPENQTLHNDDVNSSSLDINNKIVSETNGNLSQKGNAIHEAATQAFNVSNDTFDDEERPLSMEVSYDYPNTGTETVTVLEKEDGDNLPSTNETDDIQITCGQVIKSSQDACDKVSSSIDDVPESKVNGTITVDIVENGCDMGDKKPVLVNGIASVDSINMKDKNEGISVDDMLADFVDEVN